jgi:hypothetical protein
MPRSYSILVSPHSHSICHTNIRDLVGAENDTECRTVSHLQYTPAAAARVAGSYEVPYTYVPTAVSQYVQVFELTF